MGKSNLLIVDDDAGNISAMKRVLMDDPYVIYSAENGKEGLDILSQQSIKVVISDEIMPGMFGTEFLSLVSARFSEVIRIMLTGHASLTSSIKAINTGEIYRFFTKPIDDMEMRAAIKAAVAKYDSEEENRRHLRIVRKNALNMELLEKGFPDINSPEHNDVGRIQADNALDIAIERLESIIAEKFRPVDKLI